MTSIIGTGLNDVLKGTELGDLIIGFAGHDRITGWHENDTILAGIGNDTIVAGRGNDRIFAGDEVISQLDDNDLIFGGAGDDYINAGYGYDTVYGGNGNDRFDVADVAFGTDLGVTDLVFGGGGNDFFFANFEDNINGGTGIDTVKFDNREGSGYNQDFVKANVERYIFVDGENELTSSTAQNINVLLGTDNDRIALEGANNTIRGGDGADTLGGGNGKDTINGGNGVDQADYENAFSAVVVNLTAGTASGYGTDTLKNIEDAGGSNFDDTLLGNGDDNTLVGREGSDTMTGGAGEDVFWYVSESDTAVGDMDVITDFSSAEGDLIDLRFLVRDKNINYLGPVTPGLPSSGDSLEFIGTGNFSGNLEGEVRFFQSGSNVIVEIDADGNGTAEGAILLLNVSSLSTADFVL